MTVEPRRRDYFTSQPKCMADLPTVHAPKDLEAGPIGPWTLDVVPHMFVKGGVRLIAQRGYWSGFDFEPCFYRLSRHGEVWMTTSRMERESHAVHLKHAKGVVVVAGVGLGLFLFNLCRRKEVTRIVAIDVDEDLLLWCQIRAQRWVGGGKISFVLDDARTYTRTHLSRDHGIQDPPNYLYVDIWPKMGAEEALEDVRRMQAGLMAHVVGWWTQELEFVSWCYRTGIRKERIDLDAFDRWCLDVGMVVPERSSAYLRYCIAVARNTALR